MKPEKQRIAIAEACGWKTIRGWSDSLHDPHGCKCFDGHGCCVPDYLNDLNDMHEAEKTLNYRQVTQYVTHLRGKEMEANFRGCWGIHATAAQRAEAFLKTIGRWEE